MELFRQVQGDVRFNESMRRHSSFRIGGPADVFVSPRDADNLSVALRAARQKDMPVIIIGAGTNLLVSDEGIRGCVIKIGRGLSSIRQDEDRLIIGAGMPIARVARRAAELGLSGLEFAEGIPGSVGGAVVMNAGAHGADMSCVLEEIGAVDLAGEPATLSRSQLELGYRTSVIRTAHEFTVVSATVRLEEDAQENILEKMQVIGERRQSTQPLGKPCAGSIFKNPPGDYAARLIESCGLKGHRVNDAQVSLLHANFIINTGKATAADVAQLIEIVRTRVFDATGVYLQLELEVIGLEGY